MRLVWRGRERVPEGYEAVLGIERKRRERFEAVLDREREKNARGRLSVNYANFTVPHDINT